MDLERNSVPQISSLPDPIAMMPKVDARVFEAMDGIINGIPDGAMEHVKKASLLLGLAVLDGFANGVDVSVAELGDMRSNLPFGKPASRDMYLS